MLILALALLLLLVYVLRNRRRGLCDELLPTSGDAHRFRVQQILGKFDAVYEASFKQCSRETVLLLYRLRAAALDELKDAELRLPNDPWAVYEAQARHNKTARATHAMIENVKRRAGFYGFRGPIDGMFMVLKPFEG